MGGQFVVADPFGEVEGGLDADGVVTRSEMLLSADQGAVAVVGGFLDVPVEVRAPVGAGPVAPDALPACPPVSRAPVSPTSRRWGRSGPTRLLGPFEWSQRTGRSYERGPGEGAGRAVPGAIR